MPDWFYAGVIVDAFVLTIDPAYFNLTGGLERWLYRLVRKHGGHQPGGWSFDLHHLHLKSGSLSPFKRFAFELRDIVRRQPLPGYRLDFITVIAGRPRLTFAPREEGVGQISRRKNLIPKSVNNPVDNRGIGCDRARTIRNPETRTIGNPIPVLSGTGGGRKPLSPLVESRPF